MKNIVEVLYQISDRGALYPKKKMELTVKPDAHIGLELNKAIKKDSRAMDLSRNWRVELLDYTVTGCRR